MLCHDIRKGDNPNSNGIDKKKQKKKLYTAARPLDDDETL